VDERIIPVVKELEHADEYPTEIIEGLKELGTFGLTIPEEDEPLPVSHIPSTATWFPCSGPWGATSSRICRSYRSPAISS
jgi:alkylation response protein AidB-like acyl-CoA dehydrogenase